MVSRDNNSKHSTLEISEQGISMKKVNIYRSELLLNQLQYHDQNNCAFNSEKIALY